MLKSSNDIAENPVDPRDMKFARCVCFLQSNVFLPEFGIHVSYLNEKQFSSCYKEILTQMGCINQNDIERVQDEVKEELQRRIKLPDETFKRSIYIKENYQRKHPDIYQLQEDFLHPDLISVRNKYHSKADLVNGFGNHLVMHDKEVYSFPLFRADFCEKFCEELNHFQRSSMPRGKPNSMNNYGVLLNELGFDEDFMTQLRKVYLEPLCRLLFPQLSSNGFDSHKVFTVDYAENKDTALDFHFDNSEITVNVCLESEGEGGELYFRDGSEKNGFGYVHQLGRAVLHRGSLVHCVLPLVSGTRHNMVMWMRSSSVRNRRCPMCGEKPRLEPVEHGWGDGFTCELGSTNQN